MRRALVAATLFGLLAMHGVGSHGVHGAESHDMAMASGSAEPAHAMAGITDVVLSHGSSDGSGAGSEVLCVAILVGLVMALRWMRMARSLASGIGRAGQACCLVRPRARSPGAPSPVALSIMRC